MNVPESIEGSRVVRHAVLDEGARVAFAGAATVWDPPAELQKRPSRSALSVALLIRKAGSLEAAQRTYGGELRRLPTPDQAAVVDEGDGDYGLVTLDADGNVLDWDSFGGLEYTLEGDAHTESWVSKLRWETP